MLWIAIMGPARRCVADGSSGTPFVIRMTVEVGLVTRYHVAEDSHAVARAYVG